MLRGSPGGGGGGVRPRAGSARLARGQLNGDPSLPEIADAFGVSTSIGKFVINSRKNL